MTFISYAQNFEDVMLWRALGAVSEGFYIDVGAADPDQGSVTRAFYDKGWHGINIEPEPAYAAALRADRPRDINLEVAAGARMETAVIQRIAGTGLSTFDAAVAASHAAAGYPAATEISIQVVTLNSIFDTYQPDIVHFLKIDAEGAERDVLLGLDLTVHRPWIILIEATKPFSSERVTDTFEHLITGANYRFCWFDGLNAYYLAAEVDDEIRPAFQVPPNYFDNFVHNNYLVEAGKAAVAELKLASAEQRLADAEGGFHKLNESHSALLEEQKKLYNTHVRLTEDYATMHAALHAANQDRQRIHDAYDALSSAYSTDLAAANEKLQHREAALQQLESFVRHLQAEIARLDAELQNRAAELERRAAELERQHAQITTQQAQLTGQQDEIGRLAAELGRVHQDEVQHRQTEIDRLRTELDVLQRWLPVRIALSTRYRAKRGFQKFFS